MNERPDQQMPVDHTGRMVSGLTEFSLRRRITLLVLLMSTVVVGIVASVGIPVELFPRGFTSQSLFVWVPWQNAPTQEVLMGFLFESFILPLSIILTIPLAGIGVAWIHYFTGKDIDFLGIVGAILLVGVVVKNGIVLIDYVIRLRAAGMERTQALLASSTLRFRPIMMFVVRQGQDCSADFQSAVSPNCIRQRFGSVPRVGVPQRHAE